MNTLFQTETKSPHISSQKSQRCFLSNLFPYDLSMKSYPSFKKGLKEYLFLLDMAEDAIIEANKRNFSAFDPLVGENACQIRALMNAMLFQSFGENTRTLSTIAEIKEKISKLFKNKNFSTYENISLKGLFRKENIELEMNEFEIFLTMSYLLTKTKELKDPKPSIPFAKNEYTNYKTLKLLGDIGTMFAESLIKKMRKDLSYSSVIFVRKLAETLPLRDNICEFFSDDFLVRYRHLYCLPCYWVTQALMMQAAKFGIPIAMVAQQMATDKHYAVMNHTVIFFSATMNGYRKRQRSPY